MRDKLPIIMIKEAEQAFMRRLKVIAFIIVIILLAIWISRIYKAAKGGATAIGDAMGDELLSVQTNVPVTRIKWLRDQAERLNEAVTSYPWYEGGGTNIDEDAWINILTQLQTVNECIIISNFYREMKTKTGNGLKADIDDAFNSEEKARISRVYQYLR